MFEKKRDGQDGGPKAHFDAGLNDLSASQSTQSSGRAAVIGSKIRINGDVTGDENLVIEGKIEGKVELGEHRVDVGPSGQVNADIIAKVVKIDGAVNGNINGDEKVIVSRSGRVRGNIIAPRVTLEDGAKFKGSIDMDPGEKASQAKPAAKPAAAESKPAIKSNGNGNGQMPKKADAEPGLALKGN